MASSRVLALPKETALYPFGIDGLVPERIHVDRGTLPPVMGGTEEEKGFLKVIYENAVAKLSRYFVNRALDSFADSLRRNVKYLQIEDMGGSEEGLTQAYTDGSMVSMNRAVVPVSNVYFRLLERLNKAKDRNGFARYLYDKISNGYSNSQRTMDHELVHVAQEGLYEKIVDSTVRFLDRHVTMPEWLQPYKRALASRLAVKPIEGLTEATVEEANGAYTPNMINRRFRGDPSYYAHLGRMSMDSGGLPSRLQKAYQDGDDAAIDGFVNKFYTSRFLAPAA